MANDEHVELLKAGRIEWNAWRLNSPDVYPDLQDADLSKLKLKGYDLQRANMVNANMFGANLQDANLTGAFLLFARPFAALLSGANFSHAHLGSADLRKAMLSRTIFYRTNLDRTVFSEAEFGATVICDVDLSTAIGLDGTTHMGPSSVSIDTILRSRGSIPRTFLMGAGVPSDIADTLLEARAMTREYAFDSIFICHSSKDAQFVSRLHGDLQKRGVPCWFAPANMKGGMKVFDQIDEAITRHNRLLLVLSDESMQSEWVKTELRKARQKELADGHRVLFPIRLVDMEVIRSWRVIDSDTGADIAGEVCEYFIPDFTGWADEETYSAALNRLLSDLESGVLNP